MMEDHRLRIARTPVLEEDFRAVLGGDRVHDLDILGCGRKSDRCRLWAMATAGSAAMAARLMPPLRTVRREVGNLLIIGIVLLRRSSVVIGQVRFDTMMVPECCRVRNQT
jgi:hypothetical protein